MAAIFKRKKGKHEPYTIQYVDHLGKRRTERAFTDKGLSEQLAAQRESAARLRTTGMIDPEQERFADHKQSPIADHLAAFETSLADTTPKHARLTMARVRSIVEFGEMQTLAEIDLESVLMALRSMKKTNGFGHRTYNHYAQAMESFCNWGVATKRLLSSPMTGFQRLNSEVDVRHRRRALTPEEIGQFIAGARSSGERVQGFTGEQRARIYTLSYMTGLRRAEIASLTPRSFKLDENPPTVTVDAACSKHRRVDVLPLHPSLVEMLRGWVKGVAATARLFPKLELRKTWYMVQKDLQRVGIPYETSEGFADFHGAGRHSHITELLRNGTTLPEARELARHSDINMTMKYTHIGIGDQAKAVARLPVPKTTSEPAASGETGKLAALQMRCISGGSGGQSVATGDNEAETPKRQNPCEGKGFGKDRQDLSSLDKARTTGLEPAAFGSTVRCSNQLSYVPQWERYIGRIASTNQGLFPATLPMDAGPSPQGSRAGVGSCPQVG